MKSAQRVQALPQVNRNGCMWTTEHRDDGDVLHCHGAQSWSYELSVPNEAFYGDYHTKNTLLDLGDEYVGLVTYYEHERGGHDDPFLAVFSTDGRLLWRLFIMHSDLSHVFVDDEHMWFTYRSYLQGAVITVSAHLETGRVVEHPDVPLDAPDR